MDAGSNVDVRHGAMQLDTENPTAPVLVPYLLRPADDLGVFAKQGQRLLLDWDFTQPADSAAAAYFNVVWRNLLALTFHDQLPEQLWPDGGDRWFAVVEQPAPPARQPWWDNTETDGSGETATRSSARRCATPATSSPRRSP